MRCPEPCPEYGSGNSSSASLGGPDCCRIRNSGQPAGSPFRKHGSGPPSGTGRCTRFFRAPSARPGQYKCRFPDQRVRSCARGSSRAAWACRGGRRLGPPGRRRISAMNRPPPAGGSRKRFFRAQQGCEAVKQRFQRRGQQLLPLLDKGRSRRCFFAVLKPSDEYFSNAVFAHGQQQGYDRFEGQRPGTGKIPPRLPDVLFWVLPHFPNHRKQHSPQKFWCVFHVRPRKASLLFRASPHIFPPLSTPFYIFFDFIFSLFPT